MISYVVIGDIFNNSSIDVGNIITESDAIDMIVLGKHAGEEVELIIEQGVDLLALNRAIQFRSNEPFAANSQFHIRARQAMPRAVRRLAHKAKTENICVSYPRRIAEEEFELDLNFSCHNEFFLDHMTGLHIQGMALTEAMRQSFLVVTEEFFLRDAESNWYFVIRHQNTRFESFVFPFGAKLNYKIKSFAQKDKRLSFDVEMEISQAGVLCCCADVSFTAFEAEKISKRERELIEERLASIVAAEIGPISVADHQPATAVA